MSARLGVFAIAVLGMLTAATLHAATPFTGVPPASSSTPYVPDPASITREGPGYRYPQSGWIVLHTEGEPYDRGYQHGKLLAAEIVENLKSIAAFRSPKAPAEAWRDMRTLVGALFLRRYDAEYLEEMKGIADGAAHAGAKFENRPLDLVDIVALNSNIEVDFLDSGLEATPTGLEGRRFRERLCRDGSGHSRRRHRVWPHHHVSPVCRAALQRVARHQAQGRASHGFSNLSRRNHEWVGLLHERRGAVVLGDDDCADTV